VLVDELVVKRADKKKVVEISAAPMLPPPDVMRLGELAGSASRETALEIPIP
jgi:hypothetical protein